MTSLRPGERGALFGPSGFIRASKASWAIERACATRWGEVPPFCRKAVYGHLRSCSLLNALGFAALGARALLIGVLPALIMVLIRAVGAAECATMLFALVFLIANQALDALWLSLQSWSRTSSIGHAEEAMKTVLREIDRCIFADMRGLPAPAVDVASAPDCFESI